MPFAIELALDRVVGAVVRRIWRELADAGVASMAGMGVHPHITLGVWDALEVPAVEIELAAFARETALLPVRFVSVRAFPAGTVFLAPEVTSGLIETHARVQQRFARFGNGAWQHYARDVWAPHCTLTQDLPADTVARALDIARRAPLPLRGDLDRVGLVEFRPVKRLCAFDLGVRPG